MAATTSYVLGSAQQSRGDSTTGQSTPEHGKTVLAWLVRPYKEPSLLQKMSHSAIVDDKPVILHGTSEEGRSISEMYKNKCIEVLRTKVYWDKENHNQMWDANRIIEAAKPEIEKKKIDGANYTFPSNTSIFLTDEDLSRHYRRFNDARESLTHMNGMIVLGTKNGRSSLLQGLGVESRDMPLTEFTPSDVKVYIPPASNYTRCSGTRSTKVPTTEEQSKRIGTVLEIYGKMMSRKTSDGVLPSSKVIQDIMEEYKGRGYGLLSVEDSMIDRLPWLERPVPVNDSHHLSDN